MRSLLAFAALIATPVFAQSPAYPPGNSIAAHSGNVANAAATATIPAQAGRLNYLNGVIVTAGGATAAAVVTCTIIGLQGGTMSFTYGAPLGAGVQAAPLVLAFLRPLPASAVNTAITTSCPALGAGNTRMTITARGYFE